MICAYANKHGQTQTVTLILLLLYSRIPDLSKNHSNFYLMPVVEG